LRQPTHGRAVRFTPRSVLRRARADATVADATVANAAAANAAAAADADNSEAPVPARGGDGHAGVRDGPASEWADAAAADAAVADAVDFAETPTRAGHGHAGVRDAADGAGLDAPRRATGFGAGFGAAFVSPDRAALGALRVRELLRGNVAMLRSAVRCERTARDAAERRQNAADANLRALRDEHAELREKARLYDIHVAERLATAAARHDMLAKAALYDQLMAAFRARSADRARNGRAAEGAPT
jgi:hypothetical protein